MSDEPKQTKEEIQANLKKLEAETKKIEAETRQALAEAAKAEAEVREAELDAWTTERAVQIKLATDEENHLYRFDGEVSKNSVNRCMKKLTEWSRLDPKCKMEIVFSSPGGGIISGFELFDFIQDLRSRGHHITTGSLGYAASMAGILLQAGDTRWIGHQSWMMIHRAAFGAIGKTFEVEDEVKLVKRIEYRILDVFVSRSKLSRTKIQRNWNRKDWWITADECIEMGLVDELRGVMPEHVHAKPKKRKAAKKTAAKKKK
jgi:ATP-dependent Clp endopeptidase proteolytic subunit ClpP